MMVRRCLFALALVLAVPAVQAGITITTLQPGDSGLLPSIRSGALDLHWSAMTGSGFAAQARFVDTRVSQLIQPGGGLLYKNQKADSDWIVTTVKGQWVTADASIELQAIDPATYVAPAGAGASLFGNHVRARTGQRLAMENDVDVNVGGQTYAAYSIFSTGGNGAEARTAWYDTVLADTTGTHQLTLRLDGRLGEAQPCLAQPCGMSIPAGITVIDTRSPVIRFSASYTVLDLDTLIDCDDSDACGSGGPRPKAVAQLTATYAQDDEDSLPLLQDSLHQLDFETIAGHRYLTISLMEASASNGGRVDFENSFRLTGVAGPGVLQSAALDGGDLVTHFMRPVPEPATTLLWAGALACWVALRRPLRRAVGATRPA